MRKTHALILTLLIFSFCYTNSFATNQIRQRLLMDFNWKFFKGDTMTASEPDFDDQDWRDLNLPHDWSIEGPYDENAPTRGNGGFLPTGVGWYRKHFKLPKRGQGKSVWIEFDGVYMNSDVWINGHHLGKRPYGYVSFYYDLTPFLNKDENVIAVRVDNSLQPNTRWYSGSGIYRHVWLNIAERLHVAQWGTFVTTPRITPEEATIQVQTRIVNELKMTEKVRLVTKIIAPNGDEMGMVSSDLRLAAKKEKTEIQSLQIKNPQLWNLESPKLYQAISHVFVGKTLVDEYATAFGIRSIEYDLNKGFLLNNKPVKMNGVCLHHDGGCVGAAVPERVWVRRLQKLKAMGCNAIRTSHNPVAPEFLDLCDRMGFLIQNEIFDEWKVPKGQAPYMYHLYFDEWAEMDVTATIHRDRNHPCVVMWSAGNEVPDQSAPNGHETLKFLLDIFHQEDPTRPVTVGCDNIESEPPQNAARPEFLELLDIVGYNYVDRWRNRRELYYSLDRYDHPQWKFVGTENVSNRGVRGWYSLGNDSSKVKPNYNSQMIRVEQLWKFTASHDYVIGDFMWTGIDYLGEAWWPWKHASAGVLDLCGFPKDGYHFYQSQWTTKPMLHLFPHWNWPGREGQVIPVLCYTNCTEVELFLNGKSFGEKRLEFPRQGTKGGWNTYERPQVHPTTADLHLAWDVPYEPGILKAVGKRNGEVVFTQEIQTTGAPIAIRLSVDREQINADARDVAHVQVEIVDEKGNVVPTADNLVEFEIDGRGELIGVDNGDPRDHASYQAPQRKAFNGMCLAIVQSTGKSGKIKISARSKGLKEASVQIKTRKVKSLPMIK